MEKIASFTIDHLKLVPGVYVSRKDTIVKEVITTFDLRMTSPNDEPVMNTAEVHTIEHLAATFLRNHPVYGDKTIYFGPMGCRTGFYLQLAGDLTSKENVPLMIEMFELIRSSTTLPRTVWFIRNKNRHKNKNLRHTITKPNRPRRFTYDRTADFFSSGSLFSKSRIPYDAAD